MSFSPPPPPTSSSTWGSSGSCGTNRARDGLGGYFGNLGGALSKFGQVASEVAVQIDDGLQLAAHNLGQSLRDGLGIPVAPASHGPAASSLPGSSQFQSSGLDRSMGSAASSEQGSSSFENHSEKMSCDNCGAKFAIFSRKRQCAECRCYFCSSCASRDSTSGPAKTCVRCKVLLKRPPVRADLMQLRVKDLQRYLVSKHVNTVNCVEKKDLVELVILQNGGSSLPSSRSTGDLGPDRGGARRAMPPRQVGPIERQRSFPKSYVESTHRHDWLAKMEASAEATDETAGASTEDEVEPLSGYSAADLVEDFVMVPSPSEEVAVETPFWPDGGGANNEDRTSPVSLAEECTPEGDDQGQGQAQTTNSIPAPPREPEVEVEVEGAAASLPNPSVESLASSASPSSPRRFANQGLVQLSQIETLEDLQELSVKQIKDILAVNRVNYKGVVEKDELLKIAQRLWKQEKRQMEEKDNMLDEDLCKICMDNPADCVMLECGHMCTCIACGKQMAECPICRQYVIRVVKIFKA